MSVVINDGSRLQFADLLIVDDVEFWDTLVLPDLPASLNGVEHIVAQGERIDMIAYTYYQNPTLWWLIAWANGLELLPTDLKENMRLIIPSLNDVMNNAAIRSARRG